jgi:hypothetical protein
MTQINWNRQLGLAVGLFVLGTTAYWLEYKHKPDKESAEEQAKRVFSIKDVAVQSISLSDPSKTVLLKCMDQGNKLCKAGDNSKWEIVEPSKLKADDSNANSLLSTLSNLTANETIDLKDETPEKRATLLKEYGLDETARKTARRVDVVSGQGETILYLGQPHPMGETLFAIEEQLTANQKSLGRADENRVYLVPNFFKANLEHDLTYWRDKKLLSLGAHDVASFQLEGSKAHLSAEKKDGQWLIHSGKDVLVGDIENIDALLSATVFLSAKNFTSDDKTNAQAKSALSGLSKVLSLTLQKDQGAEKKAPEPFTISFFRKKSSAQKPQPTDKLYATVSNLDPLFELDSTSVDRLDKSVKDLRLTKLITSMEQFSAKRVEFDHIPNSADPIILTHNDGKWFTSAGKVEVSSAKVQSSLDKISGNKIKDFYEGSAIPSGEKDGVKFTLGDEKNDTKRQFVFWKKDGKVYARDLLSKRNEAFLVDNSIQDALPSEKDFFKKSDIKEANKSVTPKK